MSSTRLVSRDQTTAASPLRASPTPPFVLAGKSSPVQARLTTSHASSQNLLPLSDLYRPTSPMEAKNPGITNSRSDRVDTGGGDSMESAASLLQSLKEDDDFNQFQKKRRSLLFSQSTSSTGRATSEGSPVNKRYVKMGILMSDSPTEVSTYRSHHFNNGNRNTGSSPSLPGSLTPPLSGVAQSTGTGSRQIVGSRGTPPNQRSSAIDNQDYLRRNSPAYSSPCQSEGVSVSTRPYLEGELPGMDGGDELKAEGYEVIDLKDVGSVVDSANRGVVVAVQNVQPSPPISVKSESVSVNSEESTSSPDSGYGNTPEYPNANANGEAKSVEESSQQNGVRDLHQESKLRAGSDDTDGGFNSGTGQRCSDNMADGNDSHLLTETQQARRDRDGGDPLVRPSTGSSSSAVISDCSSSEQRSRGGTNESLFSVESIISSPVQSSDSGALSSKGGEAQVFEKQPTKMYLGRQHSMPPAMGVDSNVKSNTTPRNHPNSAGPFPFHTSPSSGSLTLGTRSPNWGYSQPPNASPSGFSELHPSHPSYPSQPHTVGGMPPSQSYHNIHRQMKRSPEPQRKKFRSSSLAFNRHSDVRSSKVMKTSTLSPAQDEKDYFQVTDELAKENSHFAMSEALLTVVEQYKANQYEQELELSSSLSPLSPLPNQSTSTVGSFLSDSLGSPSHWDPMSSVSTTTPSGWTPPSSVGGISSWGSFTSVSTIDADPNESLSLRRSSRISLLELISSPTWDNSAESTAQKLLQHMATQLIGSESRENLNMSQMVLKLPTEFLTSLQLDEDLRKSVTTSSAHMRGSREWAPPRTQIIYHIKTPSKNIQKDLAAQDYRCTGCGMKVDPSQARYFRFCTYTGRYFCHNCHTNATSIIPAYVMSKWSFKRYPVSNYARDLLSKFYSEPVFTAVPKEIYERVPLMAQARDLRRQLVSIKNYLKTCRGAAHLNLTFEGYAPWTIDLTSYSLEDFVEIKGGVKMKHLRSMLTDAVAHVKSCPLCRGKGFVCEFCQNSNDIIFPFELQKIRKCKVCGCCFHKECYGKRQASCPRCLRLQKRLKQRQEENKSPTDRNSSTRSKNDYSSEVK